MKRVVIIIVNKRSTICMKMKMTILMRMSTKEKHKLKMNSARIIINLMICISKEHFSIQLGTRMIIAFHKVYIKIRIDQAIVIIRRTLQEGRAVHMDK
jgi:hypothetical protein